MQDVGDEDERDEKSGYGCADDYGECVRVMGDARRARHEKCHQAVFRFCSMPAPIPTQGY